MPWLVVTDDEDGKVEALADTLNTVSGMLEEPFQADALSTIHPTLKNYQWTLVDNFKRVCHYNSRDHGNTFSRRL